MELEIKIPKETEVKIGDRIPLTKNFSHEAKDIIAFAVVKKQLSIDKILVDIEDLDIECGGIMKDGGVFYLKEVSLVPKIK